MTRALFAVFSQPFFNLILIRQAYPKFAWFEVKPDKAMEVSLPVLAFVRLFGPVVKQQDSIQTCRGSLIDLAARLPFFPTFD
jgi:hypothetical protein